MVKKEQIIMWGSVLLVIIVLGLAFSGGENNYLNPSGNRNPANQKLMVVDQDSGEISFIQKSLQGVNAQIATDDSVILKKLEDLEKWNGDRYREIEALQEENGKRITEIQNVDNSINAKADARISQNAEKFLRHGEHVSLYMYAHNQNKWYALKDHDGQTDLSDQQSKAYWVDESWQKGRQKYARISINRMGGCPDGGEKCGWETRGGQVAVA